MCRSMVKLLITMTYQTTNYVSLFLTPFAIDKLHCKKNRSLAQTVIYLKSQSYLHLNWHA